ncbi:MAG: M48 family metalloprotease [Acidobacteria bacterium]|nr:M48 family metalloprotease [Acidobacteriota bacterium]
MAHRTHCHASKFSVGLAVVVALAMATVALAQTKITAPKNNYSVAQDVELGRQAAAEAERQMPILRDEEVASYVERIGRSLVEAIPPEFENREFRYSFKVVNARDINAFALPGGPTFVNRGMIEAARTEGEIAGVVAHELSHVALRHGTAQATKGEKLQFGAIAGAIVGSIIGGNVGSIVAQGSQFGLGAVFLRFSRDYEKQADILGSHIMAGAGYDPHDMANMFQTIERQSGSSGPQWLSDHPNPGNRYAYISKEARYLDIENPIRNTRDFDGIQARLRGMAPARSTEEIMRSGQRSPQDRRGGRYPQAGRIDKRVEYPSSRYQTYTEGNLFRVSVPENWRELPGNNSVTFAPEGAYGQMEGQDIFTHGVEIGETRNETHTLKEATDEFINALTQGNRNLRRESGYDRSSIAGRSAFATTFSNLSEVDGQSEIVTVYTTLLRNGNFFYIIAVAPEDEYGAYRRTFDKVVRSIRISDY